MIFRVLIFTISVLLFSSCTAEKSQSCITALDCDNNEICIDGVCVEDNGDTGDTGNTGNSGNTGNTGDTGNTGNTGNTGDTGNTGNTDADIDSTESESDLNDSDIEESDNDLHDTEHDSNNDADAENDDDVYVPLCGNGIEEDKGAAFSGEIVLFYLNEGTGSLATDSSGSMNNATITGAAWVDGKFGKGLSFNGTAENNIVLGYTAPVNNFTMMAWIKTAETHEIDPQTSDVISGVSGQKYLFGADNKDTLSGAGVSVGINGISVYEHGNGYMPALAVYNGSVTGWSHVAVTYTDRQPRIYLNGILVQTGLISPKTTVYAPTVIGTGAYGSFNGMIDHIRILNRPLSEAEIISAMGERCDDGVFNGTTGKCKTDCTGYDCTPGTFVFDFTGSMQTFTIPEGSGTYQVEAWGAQGGQGINSAGGLGGYAKGIIGATAGEVLNIYVGGQGTGGYAAGGFNGGGISSTTSNGGSGGGASDIRKGGQDLANRVIVAGGGGGGGNNCSSANEWGGDGGGLTGAAGWQCGEQTMWVGEGGTQSAGGAYAPDLNQGCGGPGSLGQGGAGACLHGGGGGGGYYGGGGGGYGGGGGGSGYIGGVSSGTMSNGVRSGNGAVIITRTCP